MQDPILFQIEEQNDGERLDKVLAQVDSINTRSQAAKLIDDGLVTLESKQVKGQTVAIDRKKAKASHKVTTGEVFKIMLPEPISEDLEPYDFPLDIVFENKDLVIINKPPGLVVHPAAGHAQDTLVNALLFHCKDLSDGSESKRPGIVHRLDKDTSGLIVVAKNNQAHNHLASQFEQKSAQRIYRALVFGKPKPDSGSIESFIGRHPTQRKKMASLKTVDEEDPKGKRAITHYYTLESHQADLSLVELHLETGRTHQIRVHLSDLHHQILGDPIYGSTSRVKNIKSTRIQKEIRQLQRVALHAAFLKIKLPGSNEPVEFQAPWPDDLKNIIEIVKFKNYDSPPLQR